MTVQRHILGTALLALLLAACLPAAAAAMQVPPELTQPQAARPQAGEEGYDLWDEIRDAAVKLPLAAMLGAALALRPRRRGTPPRQAAVVQTQIILAVVGAVIILVVGASLARAFGIVGAANLIRYRSKIEDPKDAVVMLSALSGGPGIRRRALRAGRLFDRLFLVGALWVIESFEPERQKRFEVTIKAGERHRLAAAAYRAHPRPAQRVLRAAHLLGRRSHLRRVAAARRAGR
jgi:hypothetical protein